MAESYEIILQNLKDNINNSSIDHDILKKELQELSEFPNLSKKLRAQLEQTDYAEFSQQELVKFIKTNIIPADQPEAAADKTATKEMSEQEATSRIQSSFRNYQEKKAKRAERDKLIADMVHAYNPKLNDDERKKATATLNRHYSKIVKEKTDLGKEPTTADYQKIVGDVLKEETQIETSRAAEAQEQPQAAVETPVAEAGTEANTAQETQTELGPEQSQPARPPAGQGKIIPRTKFDPPTWSPSGAQLADPDQPQMGSAAPAESPAAPGEVFNSEGTQAAADTGIQASQPTSSAHPPATPESEQPQAANTRPISAEEAKRIIREADITKPFIELKHSEFANLPTEEQKQYVAYARQKLYDNNQKLLHGLIAAKQIIDKPEGFDGNSQDAANEIISNYNRPKKFANKFAINDKVAAAKFIDQYMTREAEITEQQDFVKNLSNNEVSEEDFDKLIAYNKAAQNSEEKRFRVLRKETSKNVQDMIIFGDSVIKHQLEIMGYKAPKPVGPTQQPSQPARTSFVPNPEAAAAAANKIKQMEADERAAAQANALTETTQAASEKPNLQPQPGSRNVTADAQPNNKSNEEPQKKKSRLSRMKNFLVAGGKATAKYSGAAAETVAKPQKFVRDKLTARSDRKTEERANDASNEVPATARSGANTPIPKNIMPGVTIALGGDIAPVNEWLRTQMSEANDELKAYLSDDLFNKLSKNNAKTILANGPEKYNAYQQHMHKLQAIQAEYNKQTKDNFVSVSYSKSQKGQRISVVKNEQGQEVLKIHELTDKNGVRHVKLPSKLEPGQDDATIMLALKTDKGIEPDPPLYVVVTYKNGVISQIITPEPCDRSQNPPAIMIDGVTFRSPIDQEMEAALRKDIAKNMSGQQIGGDRVALSASTTSQQVSRVAAAGPKIQAAAAGQEASAGKQGPLPNPGTEAAHNAAVAGQATKVPTPPQKAAPPLKDPGRTQDGVGEGPEIIIPNQGEIEGDGASMPEQPLTTTSSKTLEGIGLYTIPEEPEAEAQATKVPTPPQKAAPPPKDPGRAQDGVGEGVRPPAAPDQDSASPDAPPLPTEQPASQDQDKDRLKRILKSVVNREKDTTIKSAVEKAEKKFPPRPGPGKGKPTGRGR